MQSLDPHTPPLESAEPASVAEVWEFLERCRFLYSEKLALIDVAGTQATWAALRNAPMLSATCIVRKDGSMRAHANAVAVYPHTWALQHLAAT
jgi:hypothetical protein